VVLLFFPVGVGVMERKGKSQKGVERVHVFLL